MMSTKPINELYDFGLMRDDDINFAINELMEEDAVIVETTGQRLIGYPETSMRRHYGDLIEGKDIKSEGVGYLNYYR